MWPELGIALRLRAFDSGVTVVQAASHSDEEVRVPSCKGER